MMGYSHAMTGAAGWLAVTSSSSMALGIYDPGPGAVVLTGTMYCAGAAMAPDADHGQASIAHSLPPLTRWIAEGIGKVSGGHRHGTHSIIGVIAFTVFAFLMSFWVMDINSRDVAIGSGLIAIFLFAFATKTFGLHRSIGNGIIGDILGSSIGPWIMAVGTAGLATYYLDERWEWLPVCMALGAFIHVLGDSLTVQGVPWLWPWNPNPPQWVKNNLILKQLWLPNGYFRLPILGRTGGSEEKEGGRKWGSIFGGTRKRGGRHKTSRREVLFITLVTVYVIYLAIYEVAGLLGAPGVLS